MKLPARMKAVEISAPGGPEVLRPTFRPTPTVASGQVLVRVAAAGLEVDLFSMVPVKRSHSVCAQGGINAANDIAKQQGYSEYQHFDETIYGGDYLAAYQTFYTSLAES